MPPVSRAAKRSAWRRILSSRTHRPRDVPSAVHERAASRFASGGPSVRSSEKALSPVFSPRLNSRSQHTRNNAILFRVKKAPWKAKCLQTSSLPRIRMGAARPRPMFVHWICLVLFSRRTIRSRSSMDPCGTSFRLWIFLLHKWQGVA